MNNPASPPGKGKRARKPEVAAFGRYLKRSRRRRSTKLTPERVAEILTESGIKTTGSSLRGYELGWNKAIDPVVLSGLARAYGIPLDDIVSVLAANRARPDMSDFEVEQVLRQARRTHHGETAAADRFAEVGARLKDIAAELIGYASDAAELTGSADRSREPPAEGGERTADADPDH